MPMLLKIRFLNGATGYECIAFSMLNIRTLFIIVRERICTMPMLLKIRFLNGATGYECIAFSMLNIRTLFIIVRERICNGTTSVGN